MSDGSIRPFEEVLAGINELAAEHGPTTTKGAVASWWSRSRQGLTKYRFPEPVARLSVGPLWYRPDIRGYRPGDGRWEPKDAKAHDNG